MNLHIRTATPADAAGVIEIFNPIIEAGIYTVFDQPFTIAAERAYIENLSPRSIFLVAEEPSSGQIVGFQSMEPFATYTRAFDHVGVIGTYIGLTRRRQGIASALFAATFQAAGQLAYEKLFTFIRADNHPALSTYLRHGFRIVGTAQKQAKVKGQ